MAPLTRPATVSTVSTAEQPIAEAPNSSWVTVHGRVVVASPHAFVLDYGPSTITVEMDDFDWYAEGRQIMMDDQVVVYGWVDDHFLERRTLEASRVYVANLGTTFYASGVDEEDLVTTSVVAPVPGRFELTGRVRAIHGRELVIDTGSSAITVDTNEMSYNPLDDEGYQQVEVGDRVSVVGVLDLDLFDRQELRATSIVTLSRDT